MFGPNPKIKFEEDVRSFNYSAALRSFIRDNFTLMFILLAASMGAMVFNGAKGVLSNKKVGTILLALMVCRAFHAGVKREVIVIEEKADDNQTTTE